MWIENQENQELRQIGILGEVLLVELLRWVLVRTLTWEEALAICGESAERAQLPGPPSALAALSAWRDPVAWRRCQRLVRIALAGGRHEHFAASIPCPTSAELGGPTVEEVWDLLERERNYQLGH